MAKRRATPLERRSAESRGLAGIPPAAMALSRSLFVAATILQSSSISLSPPHRANEPLLEGTQEFDLHRETEFSDLIEEERSCFLPPQKRPSRAVAAPVKAPLTCPEQFRFHQRFGDGPTVDRATKGPAARSERGCAVHEPQVPFRFQTHLGRARWCGLERLSG